jgi:hypothetical protein
MPFLGERHWYKYISDDQKSYKIQVIDYLAEAAGLDMDDSLPMLPRRCDPRYVWLEATVCTPTKRPARKKMIVGSSQNMTQFKPGTKLQIKGVEMQVRGYVGERRTIGRNVENANPLCQ